MLFFPCSSIISQWQGNRSAQCTHDCALFTSCDNPLQAAQSEPGRPQEKSLAASVESLGLALRLLAQLSEQDSSTALQVPASSLRFYTNLPSSS